MTLGDVCPGWWIAVRVTQFLTSIFVESRYKMRKVLFICGGMFQSLGSKDPIRSVVVVAL